MHDGFGRVSVSSCGGAPYPHSLCWRFRSDPRCRAGLIRQASYAPKQSSRSDTAFYSFCMLRWRRCYSSKHPVRASIRLLVPSKRGRERGSHIQRYCLVGRRVVLLTTYKKQPGLGWLGINPHTWLEEEHGEECPGDGCDLLWSSRRGRRLEARGMRPVAHSSKERKTASADGIHGQRALLWVWARSIRLCSCCLRS
jgi:hypothetical protein